VERAKITTLLAEVEASFISSTLLRLSPLGARLLGRFTVHSAPCGLSRRLSAGNYHIMAARRLDVLCTTMKAQQWSIKQLTALLMSVVITSILVQLSHHIT
jgi:hypothetical protein